MEKQKNFFFIFLFLFSTKLFAEEPIIVTAEKFERPYEKSSSTILKLNSEQIKKSGASTVSELLKTQAGVNLFTSGAYGKASSLFLRGTSNRHTLVIIDGMRVTDLTAIGGGSRLEFLSTQNIQSIEILKGSQGVLYGGEAIGGVLVITTKKNSPETRLKLSAGSFGEFNIAGALPITRDLKGGQLQVSHSRADGISAYNDKKTNNAETDGYETTNLRYKLERETKLGKVSANVFFQDSSSQFDSSTADISGNETTYQTYGLYSAWTKPFSNGLKPKVSLEARKIKTDSTTVSAGTSSLYFYEGSNYRGEFSLPWVASSSLELNSGVSFEREVTSALDSRFNDSKKRDRLSVYTQLRREWRNLFSEVGGRFESIESVDKKGLYRVALGHNMGPFTVKLHQASGFKAPSLYQNFSSFGNTQLKVENSTSREVSFLYLNLKSLLKAEVSFFEINYSNFVDFDSSTNRYENLGSQKNRGVEVSLSKNIHKTRLNYEGNLLRAYDPRTGQYALRRPRQRHSMSVEQKVNSEWTGRLSGHYVGERQERNNVRMPSYLTFDLNLAYNMKKETIIFDFRNFLDREYEEIRNFGTPGFNFLVTWERSF